MVPSSRPTFAPTSVPVISFPSNTYIYLY
jgi:hypothetical protein